MQTVTAAAIKARRAYLQNTTSLSAHLHKDTKAGAAERGHSPFDPVFVHWCQ